MACAFSANHNPAFRCNLSLFKEKSKRIFSSIRAKELIIFAKFKLK